jgi:hypothetical protein
MTDWITPEEAHSLGGRADRQWVVSVHTCGGSMGEAIPSLVLVGPFDEATAKRVEQEFHDRIKGRTAYEDELWALAEPLDDATDPVEHLLEQVSDYLDDPEEDEK